MNTLTKPTVQGASPLLRVDNLTVRTPHRPLVQNFSLHMQHGERILRQFSEPVGLRLIIDFR